MRAIILLLLAALTACTAHIPAPVGDPGVDEWVYNTEHNAKIFKPAGWNSRTGDVLRSDLEQQKNRVKGLDEETEVRLQKSVSEKTVFSLIRQTDLPLELTPEVSVFAYPPDEIDDEYLGRIAGNMQDRHDDLVLDELGKDLVGGVVSQFMVLKYAFYTRNPAYFGIWVVPTGDTTYVISLGYREGFVKEEEQYRRMVQSFEVLPEPLSGAVSH